VTPDYNQMISNEEPNGTFAVKIVSAKSRPRLTQ